jgi:hypothetical protein
MRKLLAIVLMVGATAPYTEVRAVPRRVIGWLRAWRAERDAWRTELDARRWFEAQERGWWT